MPTMAGGENEALLETQSYPYYDEDGYSIYSENTTKRKQVLRYAIYAVGFLVGLPLLYFLLIYLPNLAPPGVTIPQMTKVGESKVYLHPLVSQSAQVFDKDEDEETQTLGLEPFRQSPPQFDEFEFLDSNDPLLEEHLKSIALEKHAKKPVRRLIIIGDVHASLKQLTKLLDKVQYDGGKEDEVILLGDFVAKGKDSIGVLDWAIMHNSGCVLGNHELSVLERYAQFHGVSPPNFGLDTRVSTQLFDLDEEMRIAKRLRPEHVSFLASCPVINQLGPVPHMNKKQTHYLANPLNGVAVHGGLIWNMTLENQDPDVVTTVRSLLPPDFVVATDDPHDQGSQPWSRYWNKHQRLVYKSAPKEDLKSGKPVGTMVLYGHDAKRGLKYKEYTTGLDSGCVYGGKLSAEVIWSEAQTKADGTSKVVYQRQSVQVSC
ncbi:unnamed protein product [Kuraishia capsulata CBS 1993]|uniref:Calcineurin-like phosphoesterase domain-containing protein n=1 Tax=Kuraishia capsulata CBS 1993 TaxID=1382522 RepID=W6MXM0_9ASCO|nr:uncharacterized protein KUCA_T00005112001 [Kuraishia capsulata CBS 1993]CDK29125.1 unnamed protein product [Kuraishia capsulata CBS 1993]